MPSAGLAVGRSGPRRILLRGHGSWPLSSLFPLLLVLLASWAGSVAAMRPARIAELRQEAVNMFYHGYDNYMSVAFPEDELRPVSCIPLTRDPANPANVGLNDVLGNYSLTLIDSLSTLAILASAPSDDKNTGSKALRDFQQGVAALVEQYGDGRSGPSGRGARARGFDVDSKVQVFETVIRGVGGLLSAHLFAVGHLPISGYDPRSSDDNQDEERVVAWPTGFKYDGQLLRLARDLAQRLLPAFYTATGMPYPRVNLRHGIPFYANSPLHGTAGAQNEADVAREITETCSAGAGSLVLEFTVLSRLTDDPRFEQAAKRAFWAVWSRRSNIGLIGAGVDAENGHWIGALSGIGAGIDSFFEYAMKSHILLSGQEHVNTTRRKPSLRQDANTPWLDPNSIYQPLSAEDQHSDTFLQAWHHAHAAIKRHLYSQQHHPHYINAHVSTGSPQAYWIDSLGAYYPGLLTLAGEVDEAIETHLLYTALWTRYSALPERWSVRDGHVEGGLGWWPGRPEFIESTYYLYRATKDPWYLFTGEMVLKDIKRRCWTECGWSGLQDVRTGQLSDRMESFFLGETAKYTYLLFDPEHPLNKLDAPFVFTTEGHPLIIPNKAKRYKKKQKQKPAARQIQPYYDKSFTNACPVPPRIPPLSGSAIAARADLFNAATLIRLHQIPNPNRIASGRKSTETDADQQIENHSIFPWTLPPEFLPADGVCAAMKKHDTQVIEFPQTTPSVGSAFNFILGTQNVVRLGAGGILINKLSGLKIAMTMEEPPEAPERGWRVSSIGQLPLGRDETVYVSRDLLSDIADPLFNRIRDSVMLQLVLQLKPTEQVQASIQNETTGPSPKAQAPEENVLASPEIEKSSGLLSSLLQQITSALRDSPASNFSPEPTDAPHHDYEQIAAIIPTGPGVAPFPATREAPDVTNMGDLTGHISSLSWTKIFFAETSCSSKLPDAAPRQHQIIVMRRGGCSFSEKLANIPSFAPGRKALQLVIVVSGGADDPLAAAQDPYGYDFIRPLLDEVQKTPSGILRRHPIPMVMVQGGDQVYDLLRQAQSLGFRRRYHVESQGLKIHNLQVI